MRSENSKITAAAGWYLNVSMMNNFRKYFLATITLMLLTVFHHFYGSIIYPQVFRAYVAYGAVVFLGLEYFLFRKFQKSARQNAKRRYYITLLVVTWAIPLALIGFIEGGYNHFLKNLLFFAGVKLSLMTRLFPPPMYEMPNNFLFEFTGTMQFFISVYAVVLLLKWKRGGPGPERIAAMD